MKRSLKQVLLGGAMWAGAGKLISLACNFVMTIVLTHAISPAAYGGFHVVMTSVVILATVGTLGMDQVVVRFASMFSDMGDQAGVRRVISTCVRSVVMGGLATGIVFYFAAPWFMGRVLEMPVLLPYLGIIAIWLVLATIQRQLAETWRGLNDVRFATLFGGVRNVGILTALTSSIAMLVLWMANLLSLGTALSVMLATSALTIVANMYNLRRRLSSGAGVQREVPRNPVAWSAPLALSEGWPLWLATMLAVLNALGSTWLASAYDTSAHVALFGVAQRVAFLLLAPLIVVNAILPPVVAQLHAKGEIARMQRVVQTVSGAALLPCIALLLLLVVVGRPVLGWMFGSYYAASFPILLLVCGGQMANIATGAWQVVLPMTGAKHQMLTVSGVALALQGILGVCLGATWGVMGVAVAYCVSVIATNVLGMAIVKRKLGIWTYATLTRTMFVEMQAMIREKLASRLRPEMP